MPESKPIAFKAPKQSKKTPAKSAKTEASEEKIQSAPIEQEPTPPPTNIPTEPVEEPKAPEVPPTTENGEDSEEAWEARIKAAKAAQTTAEPDASAAAERLAAKLGKSADIPPRGAETKSVEEPKSEPAAKPEPKGAEKKVEEKPAEEEKDESFQSYWDENAGSYPVKGNAEYVPSDEEKERYEHIKDVPEHDASGVITTTLGTNSDITKDFELINETLSKYKNLTKEDIDANPEIKSVVDWLNDLNVTTDTSLHTDQQRLLIQMIDALNRNGIALKQLDRRLSISKASSSTATAGQPKLLRGNAAMQMINNRYRGVYKIQLYNSGFWIKVTPLRNIDIDAWMHEVDFQRKQLGRLIGGHFYLGMNIYLKEKLADLLKVTVVESNLEGWNTGTTLVDSISIHDYDTLCWAFSTMMHKEGVLISTVCVNPECKHRNPAQHLDLARCAFINPDVFNEQAMQWMLAGSAPGVVRTQKDIKEYKEKILKNVRLIKFTETDQCELKDPSLGEFIRVGMAMLGRLAARVKDGKLTNDNEEVRRYAVYHLTKMMSPWISKIIIRTEDGKIDAVVDDRDAITSALETTMDDKFEVVKHIEEFITTSKATFFTAFNFKCSRCGHQPNLLKDNLAPLDVEYILFCLSYLKLDQIGIEQ